MTKRLIALVSVLVMIPFGVGNLTGFFVLPGIVRHYRRPVTVEEKPIPEIVPAPGFPAERFDEDKPKYFPAPKDAPPSPIAIGPYRWTIRYVKLSPGGFAVSYPKRLEIDLDVTLPRDQMAETLLHEIYHGTLFIGGGGAVSMQDEPQSSDTFIEQSAPTMVQVFRDNPELVAWLARKGPVTTGDILGRGDAMGRPVRLPGPQVIGEGVGVVNAPYIGH